MSLGGVCLTKSCISSRLPMHVRQKAPRGAQNNIQKNYLASCDWDLQSTTSQLFGEICKWLKHADCKSVLYEFAGSNPALTTILRVVRKGGLFWFTASGRAHILSLTKAISCLAMGMRR